MCARMCACAYLAKPHTQMRVTQRADTVPRQNPTTPKKNGESEKKAKQYLANDSISQEKKYTQTVCCDVCVDFFMCGSFQVCVGRV